MKKLIIIFIILAIVLSGVTAYIQFRRVVFKYEDTDDGTYMLKKYTGISTEKTVTIPDEYKGKKATKPITHLKAFSISNCDYLEEVVIGKNITYIDEWALTNNRQLKRITVHAENPNYCSVDGVLFNKEKTKLLVYPNSKDLKEMTVEVTKKFLWKKYKKTETYYRGYYTIPDGVTEVGSNAFYKCKTVEEVTFPDSVTVINSMAFHECDSLKTVTLPANLTKIGMDAFSYNNSFVEAIILPKSLTEIGDFAFFNCQRAQKIVYSGTADEWSKISKGKKWQPIKYGKWVEKVPLEFASSEV